MAPIPSVVFFRWLLCVTSVLPAPVFGLDQFYNRMMRNPGLGPLSTSTCADTCVSSCQSTSGCSAVSYQFSTRQCMQSRCNNLDLVEMIGWITFTIAADIVENSTVPAPQLEWMLTDACGVSNQGVRAGPKMNLYNVKYTPSLSVYAGNAANFSGSSNSFGVTDSSSACNFPMGDQSLSVMAWVRYNSPNWVLTAIAELVPIIGTNSDNPSGLGFWSYVGYYLYTTYLKTASSDSYAYNYGGYSWSWWYVSGDWLHTAFVYDGQAKLMKTYLNYSLVGASPLEIKNFNPWNYVKIGNALFSTNNLNGSMFCLKIVSSALNNNQVAALGQSCIVGKVRLS